MIELHVEPRVTRTWEAFCQEAPPNSIALDGYVHGPPAFSPAGPHANFDHHARVDRLSTRSTCMQVYLAVSMGLFDTFQRGGKPFAHVYVNDPDQDTCLGVWVLRHPDRCSGLSIQAPLARLLVGEDLLDCTGGAYPVSPNRPGMQEQAWIFEPYVQARTQGELFTMDAARMEALIDEVGERIARFVDGKGERVDLDTRLEEIGGGPGWRLIIERGPHARSGLFAAGIRAFVAVRENSDGSYTYTVSKMSPYVRFPVDAIYRRLNQAEGLGDSADVWGGSNTIGGSPRKRGSRLPPKEVERLVNEVLATLPPAAPKG